MTRLSSDIEAVLQESGLPWRIEKGARHHKVIVGTQFAGILPRGNTGYSNKAGRAHKNIIAQIRRAIRKQKEATP